MIVSAFGEVTEMDNCAYVSPIGDRMPLLLIPLTISPAFLLVSERTIAVYKLEDVLEGESKPRFRGEIPKDPKDPVSGMWGLSNTFTIR
jgi:hypothetical protein